MRQCDSDKRHLHRHLKVNEKLQIMENALASLEKPKQSIFHVVVCFDATLRIIFFDQKQFE